MTDHKFTDDEIIKALECSVEYNVRKNASCDGCPLEKVFPYCNRECSEDTLEVMCLALINRQKAEIEEQHQAIINALKHMGEIRAEAIKEFAQRLREIARMPLGTLYGTMVYLKDIDTLEKEMTEGGE